jgi:hypothetical protein
MLRFYAADIRKFLTGAIMKTIPNIAVIALVLIATGFPASSMPL